jgi:hypothetical protein
LQRGPDIKNPAGAGLRRWRSMASLGPNGSIQTAAIGIDDCLSLQRDSLRNQLSKPWTKLEPPARYDYLFDFT